jgi:ATP adenylyltransferase
MESTFATGTLWKTIQQRSQAALKCNALLPIETRQISLPDNGVDFLVRQVSSLVRKHDQTHSNSNPFLPYDPDLFVSDVSPGHVCLLNKFNVIEHHVLIVTRDFEHQDSLLTEADFAAWFRCMQEFNSLGFYNGGLTAGASQSHKHMQLIPLPLAEGELDFPMLRMLQNTCGIGDPKTEGNIQQCGLPFRHGIIALQAEKLRGRAAAVYLRECYAALMQAVGIKPVEIEGDNRPSSPYNLLFTPQWMWLVLRSRECFDSISINALGYAGSLFVRNALQLEVLRQAGPMAVLRSVSLSP